MFQYENQIISNNLLPELLNALLISFISFIIIFIFLFQYILLYERYNKLLFTIEYQEKIIFVIFYIVVQWNLYFISLWLIFVRILITVIWYFQKT